MSEMFKEVSATKFNGEISTVKEKIVNDEEIEIIINDLFSRRFFISPNSLKEFVVGYLLGEGLVGSIDDITRVEVDGNTIRASVDVPDFDFRKELVVGSDCFGGWRHKIETVEKVDSNYKVSKEDIFDAFEKLKYSAKIWRQTGGTHIAGMVKRDKFISMEDVSRHVAIDKVIGAGALERVDFENIFIVYSGRMPADMLIKVARMGIPIVTSNAAPTSSGFYVAEESGITLVGFVRDKRFNIYTHPERILI